MSSQTSCNAHLSCFVVAHLPHENHIRGLPQHRPDDLTEIEPNAVLDLDLVDARQIVFNWILGGDDLYIRPVQFVEGCIERGGLSGASRTADQKNSVRSPDQGAQRPEIPLS